MSLFPPHPDFQAPVFCHCCRKHSVEEKFYNGERFTKDLFENGVSFASYVGLRYFFFLLHALYIFLLGPSWIVEVFCCSLIHSIVHCRGDCIQVVCSFRPFIWRYNLVFYLLNQALAFYGCRFYALSKSTKKKKIIGHQNEKETRIFKR